MFSEFHAFRSLRTLGLYTFTSSSVGAAGDTLEELIVG